MAYAYNLLESEGKENQDFKLEPAVRVNTFNPSTGHPNFVLTLYEEMTPSLSYVRYPPPHFQFC